MTKKGREFIYVTIEFEWHHPKNRCIEWEKNAYYSKKVYCGLSWYFNCN